MSPKIRFKFSKRTIVIISIITVIGVGSLVTGIMISQKNKTTSDEVVEQPQFTTVLPKGKSVTSLGGWSRISPPSSDPVFAYNDTIDGVSVTISEQPLPAVFAENPEAQVEEITKGGAYRQLASGDIKIQIGNSSQGPQSVVFAKNDLLILIKSQQKVDDKEWVKYIESLTAN